MASIKINKEALMKSVSQQLEKPNRSATQAARDAANRKFIRARNEAIRSFNNHAVTKEIEAGPGASSSFLPKGNLFSFLGFYAGEDPVGQLRALLTQNIIIDQNPSYNGRLKRYYFRVSAPTQEELYSATTGLLVWQESKSWIELVQEGVDNLNHYLYSRELAFKGSRSGPAVQSKGEVPSMAGAEFGGVEYIDEIVTLLRSYIE